MSKKNAYVQKTVFHHGLGEPCHYVPPDISQQHPMDQCLPWHNCIAYDCSLEQLQVVFRKFLVGHFVVGGVEFVENDVQLFYWPIFYTQVRMSPAYRLEGPRF